MDRKKIIVISLFCFLFFHLNLAFSTKPDPAVKLEKIGDTGISSVTITAEAVNRLGIKTIKVSDSAPMIIPYAALIYDPDGGTWIYTNPAPQVFVRKSIAVDKIEGENVHLKEGIPAGTMIVIVGVDELYGAETGIGK